jgi:hypothetical protein
VLLLLQEIWFILLTYQSMLRCSHNTEGQIYQDSSVSVEIGTRLEIQVLPFGFLDVLMVLRCTTLPFLYFLFLLKLKHHTYSVSNNQWDTGPLIWNSNKITALSSHSSIHNRNLMLECPSVYLMWTLYIRQSYGQTS